MGGKEMFELTTPQRSIWMMEQFYKGTNINNICATLTINKDVDIKKLNQAINIFVQRNKSFGLNFKIVNGELKQYFTELKDIQFEQVKLKDKKAVRKLAKETAEEIFDIEGERLFKFKLFNCNFIFSPLLYIITSINIFSNKFVLYTLIYVKYCC